MSAAPVPIVVGDNLHVLSSRQREIVRRHARGETLEDIAADLGIGLGGVRSTWYQARKRLRGLAEPAKGKYQHDSEFDDETPVEARRRVSRELACGARCRHPMLSGAPCSLLLPCYTHGGQ